MQLDFLLGNKGAHVYNGNHTCQNCQKVYTTEERLANHKCTHCHKCSKTYSTYQRLQNHKCVLHTPQQPSPRQTLQQPPKQTCIHCNKMYASKYTLKMHKCSHCDKCQKTFPSYRTLIKHKCSVTTQNITQISEYTHSQMAEHKKLTMQESNSSNHTEKCSTPPELQTSECSTPPKKQSSESSKPLIQQTCECSKCPKQQTCEYSKCLKQKTSECSKHLKHQPSKCFKAAKGDDSEDVAYSHTEIIDTDMFKPVNFQWQIDKCTEINTKFSTNINITIAHPNLEAVSLDTPDQKYGVQGDGNCFFRCVSYILTGSQEYHFPIRQIVVHHMCCNPVLFKCLLSENTTMSSYISISGMMKDRTWATDVEIYATAHMLQTDIYTYTLSGHRRTWLKFAGTYSDPTLLVKNVSMYINHHGQHYDVVKSVQASRNSVSIHSCDTSKNENSLQDLYKEILHQASLSSTHLCVDEKTANTEKTSRVVNQSQSENEKNGHRKSDTKNQAKHRQRRPETKQQLDKMKDASRKSIAHQRRADTKQELDKVKDTIRKKIKRQQRGETKQKFDKLKDASRKSIARQRRTETKQELDQVNNARRKLIARQRRTEKKQELDQVNNARRMSIARQQRAQTKQKFDKVKDAIRKTIARQRRSKTKQELAKVNDAIRKTKARLRRSESMYEMDKAKDSIRKSTARQERPYALKELKKTKDSIRKYRKRKSASKHIRSLDIRRDKLRKKRHRQPVDSLEKAVIIFKTKVQDGPTYICTCCNRLLFKNSVSRYKASNYRLVNQELLMKCRTSILSADGIEYVCNLCKQSLVKGHLPSLAVANGLQVEDVPQPLHDLTPLEAIFIARRIPFMKLLALPRGKQKAIHGCIVNIPVDPEQSVAVLPRIPSPESVITVKLKRKLQYRGHVMMQNIRPFKIKQALHMLKHGLHNPHYEDVIINDEWENDSIDAVPEVWDALVQKKNTDNEDILDSDDDSDIEDDRTKLSGLPYDSCIQPKDITADNNLLLNIAPGEGKRPQSFNKDEHAEELSFPQLFPSGCFAFSSVREKKITQRKYFQSRLLHCDGRFAKNLEYIFYAQYRTEAKDIADYLSISLRKGKEQTITAGHLKENVSDFIRSDLGIHFLQKVRGSPAFFNKMLYDLLGMIRQLGACTWFITLSAADLKWTDTIRVIACQCGQILTDKDVQDLSWEERCAWLRSNPVTAARHFDHRVQLLFKHLLLNRQLKPLGQITDYKYRIEFQQRGSPHVHMLAWVKDAPNFEHFSEDSIQQFVDSHISCTLPADDEDLCNLLTLVQKHTHSVACRKHGDKCRFHFPRPPVRQTMAVSPPTEHVPAHLQELYTAALQAVQDQLEKMDASSNMSLDTLLLQANVSEERYTQALRWIKTKNGQPAILLQRKPCEVNINNYNIPLMKAWEANIDVQFVTNVYSCVMYVASYISKSEKTLGDVLKAVSESGKHLGAKESMKHVAKKFLTHREISAQEAVYRLLSLPLTRSSRQVIFVPTDLPANRTRLFKPMKVIETLDDDDPAVFLTSVLDRYQARPMHLEDICLADFAATYSPTSKPPKQDIHPDELADEADAEDGEYPKCIKLKNGLGHMILRGTPAIVRSHQFSEVKEPEQYYHAQLLLYHPWRNETVDLCVSTYKQFYLQSILKVEENRARHEYHSEAVHAAMDELTEYGAPEDAWADLAAQAEQARHEDQLNGVHPDPNSVLNAFDSSQDRQAARDLGLIPHEYQHLTEQMTNQQWFQMILSLNPAQFSLHRFIVNWCTDMILSHRISRPDSFHIFLTGGAGSGKSHLVRTIVQTVTNLFSRNNQKEETHILVCAPTGAAAYNISGYTLHAAFLLPLTITKHDDYIHLSNEKLTALKESIGNLKILIIDEISMVGSDMLLTIHRRLCDIMGNDKLFGGVSVLAVGDLLQLPPVGQRPVFSTPTDELAAIYGSLWQTHFQLLELTEIVRQQNDNEFASLLNRVRTGNHTSSDIELLNTRQPTDVTNCSKETTHVFAYNRLVNAHNIAILESLNTRIFVFNAVDSRKDSQTGRVEVTSFSDMSGGLAKQLRLTVQARVILTKNLDVSDGLVNSAAGVVTGFIPEPVDETENFKPKFIMVQFDEKRVGNMCRQLHKSLLQNQQSTPIPAVETQVQLSRCSKVTAKRTQFPLALAWAVTIHKEQGKTEDKLVISCEGAFQPGQFYTAISRTKTLNGLFIIGDIAKKIKVNYKSLAELRRMKSDSTFKLTKPSTMTCDEQLFFKIGFLNTNSLLPHSKCVVTDTYLTSSHVICLAETWLTATDVNPDIPNHFHVHQDLTVKESERRRGGLLMYIHHDFLFLKQFHVPNVDIHHLSVLLSPRWNPHVRICVVCLYRNPNSSLKDFLPELESLLTSLPVHAVPTFVCGDFNVDLQADNSAVKQLLHLTSYYGLKQHVKSPTHRRGGLIDHMYMNRHYDDVQLALNPVYYSDHLHVSAAIPFQYFDM